jgi:serine/threonine protein kinase
VWSLGILLATMLESQPPFQSSDVNECPKYAAFIASGASTLHPRGRRLDSADDAEWARLVEARIAGGNDATAPAVANETKADFGSTRGSTDEAAQRDWLEQLILEMLHPNPEVRPTSAQVLHKLGSLTAGVAPAIPAADGERLQTTNREQIALLPTAAQAPTRQPGKLDYGFFVRGCLDATALLERDPEQLRARRLPTRLRWPSAARDDADILTAIEASLQRLGVAYGKQNRHTFVLELPSSVAPSSPSDSSDADAGGESELHLLLELISDAPGPLCLNPSGLALVSAAPAPAGEDPVSPYHLLARDVCGSAGRYSTFSAHFLTELSDNMGRGTYAELAVVTAPSPFSIRLMNSMLAAGAGDAAESPPMSRAETYSCKRQRHEEFHSTQRIASPFRW